MILFNTQNENDEIVYLQNKRIKTKHATKLELKLTELTLTENNYTDKRYCDAIIRTKP